jgi:hypothetical protein
VNRRLAKWLKWGLPVVWETDDSPQAAVTATVVQVVHVHYHLHLAPGQNPADAIAAARGGSQLKALQTADTLLHFHGTDPEQVAEVLRRHERP